MGARRSGSWAIRTRSTFLPHMWSGPTSLSRCPCGGSRGSPTPFSKKLENHAAALGLFHAHYNLCRIHKSLRVTPAMAAGVGVAGVGDRGSRGAASEGGREAPGTVPEEGGGPGNFKLGHYPRFRLYDPRVADSDPRSRLSAPRVTDSDPRSRLSACFTSSRRFHPGPAKCLAPALGWEHRHPGQGEPRLLLTSLAPWNGKRRLRCFRVQRLHKIRPERILDLHLASSDLPEVPVEVCRPVRLQLLQRSREPVVEAGDCRELAFNGYFGKILRGDSERCGGSIKVAERLLVAETEGKDSAVHDVSLTAPLQCRGQDTSIDRLRRSEGQSRKKCLASRPDESTH